MPLKDKEAERLYMKEYYLRNKEHIRELQEVYREEHKDEIRQNMKEYACRNKQRLKVYRAAKKERWAELQRKKYHEDPHVAAARLNSNNARRAQKFNTQTEDLTPLIKEIRELKEVVCYLCGKILAGKDCHIEHVIPLSRGGSHTKDNVLPACPPCNLSKGSMTPEEYFLGGNYLEEQN